MIHPDAVVRPIDEWPDDDVPYGIEGFEKLTNEWTQQFHNIQLDGDRFESVLNDGVLALFNLNGKIKGTRVPAAWPS